MAITFVPQVLPFESDFNTTACFNTGCGVTLVNKAWFLRQFLQQKIKEMSTPLKIRGIRSSKYKSAQFEEVFLFLLGENMENRQVYTLFKYKLHLIEGLQVNILVGDNIFTLKGFILNFRISHVIVRSCEVIISIKTK